MATLSITLTLATPSVADENPRGWLIPPVDGAVGERFVDPLGPYAAGHRGIDYSVPAGTLVRAAASGRVTFAGPVANVRAVSIDHGDGLTTTYSSLGSTLVQKTDEIGQGEWLGRTAVAHEGGAPGLHFGVRLDGDYVDPFSYLGPVGVAGAIHLAPLVSDEPPLPAGSMSAAIDALAEYAGCEPVQPVDDPPPPNGNVAIAIAGLGSKTEGEEEPDIYRRGPALLGFPRSSIYRFSYNGARGPALHQPYDRTATYRDLRDSAERLRALLLRIARRAPGRRVDLIAHSQGGLVARFYLESLHHSWDARLPVVDHLVTFATPHEGAPLAGIVEPLARETISGGTLTEWLSQRARGGSGWPDPLSDAVRQLRPGSPLLQSLAREDVSFGTRALALGIANDVVVPADRARLRNELSRVVGPSGLNGHSAILSAGDSLATAYAFLRDAPPPCPGEWDVWGPRLGAAAGWLEGRLPSFYGALERALVRRALVGIGARKG